MLPPHRQKNRGLDSGPVAAVDVAAVVDDAVADDEGHGGGGVD